MKGRFDIWIFVDVVILVGLGVVMVYSASFFISRERYGDYYLLVKKQLARAALGAFVMLSASAVNYRSLRKFAIPGIVLSVVFLVLVLIPSLGREVGGARRWLKLPVIGAFQPSEFAKFSLVLYIADALSRKGERIKNFLRGTFPLLIIVSLCFLLIVREPNMGMALVVSLVSLSMLFAGGVKLFHLLIMGAAGVVASAVLIATSPFRMERLAAFLDPSSDPTGSGFQIRQSIIALGSGGFLGVGLGDSHQKLFYLPEPHTDFIFAILGEELGFLGTFLVMALLGILVWRGMRIAVRVEDRFGSMLAFGIASMIGWQAIVNIGMATGLLPVVGIPLPFISFGGSSLVAFMGGVGVLLSISLRQKI
ncbi:MAG: putative lipid II flippase FtsW [bacterium]